MEIGKRIRKIRQAKGLSMYRLTQETGISGQHIKGIEEGTRQPTIETLQKLIVPLGITMAELFNENEECSFLSEKERELIEIFRTLDNERAEEIIRISRIFKN